MNIYEKLAADMTQRAMEKIIDYGPEELSYAIENIDDVSEIQDIMRSLRTLTMERGKFQDLGVDIGETLDTKLVHKLQNTPPNIFGE